MQNQAPPQATCGKFKAKIRFPENLISQLTVLVCVSSLFAQLADSLQFSAVHIPALVQRNTNFWLSCQFELGQVNKDRLYGVKWYKNNVEFYRFQPNELANRHPSYQADSPSGNGNGEQQYFSQAGISIMPLTDSANHRAIGRQLRRREIDTRRQDQMGSSNATHVRLLNATLESEGLYACEISTENLSTIRYEREIRVYVLPRSKLSIVGLKNRYSIGDQVSLTCATDFSRPKPALSWFVNGRRIAESSKWFSLELRQFQQSATNRAADGDSESLTGSGGLFRLNLKLKFELTTELLAFLGSLASSQQRDAANISKKLSQRQQITGPTSSRAPNSFHNNNQQRNQSQSKQSTHQHQQQQLRTKQLLQVDLSDPVAQQLYQSTIGLKLQCKYKLTEVSDVTFNELLVRQVGSSNSSRAPAESPKVATTKRKSLQRRGCAPSRKWTNATESGRRIVERAYLVKGILCDSLARKEHVMLWKSGDNQVIQTISPAEREEMKLAVQEDTHYGLDCGRGMQELHYDDPLIVLPELQAANELEPDSLAKTDALQDDNDELEAGEPARRRARRALQRSREYSVNETISVDCSTIGALLNREQSGQTQEVSSSKREMLVAADEHDQVDSELADEEESSESGLEPTPIGPNTRTGGYCGDPSARRRSLISGKYYSPMESQLNSVNANEELSLTTTTANAPTMTNQRIGGDNGQVYLAHKGALTRQRRPIGKQPVGYLSLSVEQRQSLRGDRMMFEQLAADGPGKSVVGGVAGRQQLDGLGSFNADSGDSTLHEGAQGTLVPPLLEWFINNQEAPRSSAGYEPELPLQRPNKADGSTAPLNGGGSNLEAGEVPDQADTPDNVLPSIDYPQYFANFDNRPLKQHLSLNLTLNKGHFLTSDSALRLRCSSTQAQLLWQDAASVSIVAIGDQQAQHGWKLQKQNLFNQKTGARHPARADASASNQRGNGATRAAATGNPSRMAIAGAFILSIVVIIISNGLKLR